MKLIIPDYYNEFYCIAERCKDSCCKGWELDIDDDTFDYYETIDGDFGERLKSVMVRGEDETDTCNTFRLINNSCPFLNSRGLCDIYIELGKEHLCKVCRDYPRFSLEYGDILEKSLALSCEAVCELVFKREDKIGIIELEIERVESLESDFPIFAEEIRYARDKLLEILSDRSCKLHDRIKKFLVFSENFQSCLNDKAEGESFLDEVKNFEIEINSTKKADTSELISEAIYILEGLEILGDDWLVAVNRLKNEAREETLSKLIEYSKTNKSIDIWFEHILKYFTFRYFTKAVYDADVLSRAKFIFFSYFIISLLLSIRYAKKKELAIEDIIYATKVYSKEVEHSLYNISYLQEEFIFSEKFSIDNIISIF